jgi:glycosyltransferase involved in cell wall biosynthesis
VSEASPAAVLRVLYLSGRRGRERELLAGREGVELEHQPLWLRRDLGRPLLRALHRASAAARHADVVLVESPAGYALLGLWLKRRRGLRLAVRLKGDPWAEALEARRSGLGLLERAARLGNFLAARAVLAGADAVLPNSEELGRRAAERLPELAARLRLVPAAVAAPPAPVKRPERPDHVLTVTRFQFRDKTAPLVAAAPALVRSMARLGLHWRILGGGPFLGELEFALRDAPPGVAIEGEGDAHAAYARGPLCVLYFTGLDGLPRALLEAWAHGLPLVVNRGGPAAALVKDGVDGLVVEEREEAMAAALERLRDDRELADRLAARGRERALAEFSPAVVGTRLLAVLRDLAGACARGGKRR